MARKRISPTIKGWEEADKILLEIGRLERGIEQAEANLQETIARSKESTAATVKELQAQIKLFDLQLQVFCKENQADLGDKKSRVLNFGKVGFQHSTRIILPRKKEAAEAVIKKLKELGLKTCIKVKETPLKNEIKKLDDATLDILKMVGVAKKGGDTFYHEVFREKIVEAA